MTLTTLNFRKTLACVTFYLLISACGTGSDHGSVNLVLDNIDNTAAPDTNNGTDNNPHQGSEFVQELDNIRQQYNLPAAGGLLIYNGEILEHNVTGIRSSEYQIAAEKGDRWHLGSITKSMTATLAGRLVEANLIRWDSRLAEIFPVLTSDAAAHLKDITLSQLLSHTSGLQRDFDWEHYRNNNLSLQELRLMVLQDALDSPTVINAGEFSYSNLGYVIAGAMLERVSGKSWELLMQEELFTPLQISEVGFGAPTGIESQPSGHWRQNNGALLAIAGELPEADNPPVIAPAGTVNMSLTDLAKYVSAHMVGELGDSDLLSAETFRYLHTEVSDTGYGMGWFIDDNSIRHDGSNRLWFARVGISVQQQIAVISVTNIGGDSASVATDSIINIMLAQHFN